MVSSVGEGAIRAVQHTGLTIQIRLVRTTCFTSTAVSGNILAIEALVITFDTLCGNSGGPEASQTVGVTGSSTQFGILAGLA